MALSLHQDSLSKRVDFLRKVPLFTDLQEADLATLAGDFHLKEYRQDEIIFRQGDTGRELYIVLSGKVRIFKVSPSGNETSLNIFSTYDILGEFTAIDDEPRSATAKAIVPSALLVMRQANFLQHMRTMPDIALGVTRLLVNKLRWTADFAEATAQYDAAGRLLHILLLYNEQFGEAQEGGKRYMLDLGLNQADLASLVGARREWINRLLKDWRKRGLIEHSAGKITILDLRRVETERNNRIEVNQLKW
jgi:CRP-like cAMP-binding protein